MRKLSWKIYLYLQISMVPRPQFFLSTSSSYFFLFFFSFSLRFSNPGWPWIHNPPASVSRVTILSNSFTLHSHYPNRLSGGAEEGGCWRSSPSITLESAGCARALKNSSSSRWPGAKEWGGVLKAGTDFQQASSWLSKSLPLRSHNQSNTKSQNLDDWMWPNQVS